MRIDCCRVAKDFLCVRLHRMADKNTDIPAMEYQRCSLAEASLFSRITWSWVRRPAGIQIVMLDLSVSFVMFLPITPGRSVN